MQIHKSISITFCGTDYTTKFPSVEKAKWLQTGYFKKKKTIENLFGQDSKPIVTVFTLFKQ